MTNGTFTIQQNEYCWHRLPCGFCMMLDRPCPMQGNQVKTEPTWKLPEITCQTKKDDNNG